MRVRGALAVTMLAMLGACVTPDSDGEPVSDDSRFTCNAERLASLVGRVASTELGAEALRASGARTIRWIQPGTAVTMDYRTDRLNVDLDSANRVTGFRCG